MKKKCSSIWVQSPCTLGFVQRNVVFQKQARFSVHSIYYQEKLQPKEKIKLEIIRPQSSLVNFRRQIFDCEKYRRKISRHTQSALNLNKTDQKIKKILDTLPSEKVIQRLTSNEPIYIDKIYDRNGIRSTFYTSSGEQNLRYSFKKSKLSQEGKQNKIKGPKVYVSGSARIDLSKPENFNPGPGSYFLDTRDNQEISQIYRRAHKHTSKNMTTITVQEQYRSPKKQFSQFFKLYTTKDSNKPKNFRLERTSTTFKSNKKLTFFNFQ